MLIYLFIFLSIYLSAHLSICSFIYLCIDFCKRRQWRQDVPVVLNSFTNCFKNISLMGIFIEINLLNQAFTDKYT